MLFKLLSTKAHGSIDYATAGALLVAPRVLGLSERVTTLLTGAALGTLGYSLLTRYERGLVRVLPMRAHLALDLAQGAALCAAPLLLPDEDDAVKAALVGLGVFELAVTLATDPNPGPTVTHRDAPGGRSSDASGRYVYAAASAAPAVPRPVTPTAGSPLRQGTPPLSAGGDPLGRAGDALRGATGRE
jgi:hypothetical protein